MVRLESSLIPPSYVFSQTPLVSRSFPRGSQFICLTAHGAAGLCLSREGRLGCNSSLSWWTHTCHSSRTRWACLPLTPTQNMAVSQGNGLPPGPLEPGWCWGMHRLKHPCPRTAGTCRGVQSEALYKDYHTLTNSQSVLFINTNIKSLLIKHMGRVMINR